MIIILCLYLVALWAVFSKFKLVRWGWLSGTVSLLVGGFILATFLALLNYLTPSGRVSMSLIKLSARLHADTAEPGKLERRPAQVMEFLYRAQEALMEQSVKARKPAKIIRLFR